MPRHFWISASVAVLVAALALLAFALPGLVALDAPSAGSGAGPANIKVVTYEVPAGRAKEIRETLDAVLFASRDGVQPLGRASVVGNNQLIVSAPSRMHDSIRRALGRLAEGETERSGPSHAAIEIRLIEATSGDVRDDLLADAADALDEARDRFGHAGYRLLERTMLVTDLVGSGATSSATLMRQAQISLRPGAGGSVDLQLVLTIAEGQRINQFSSRMLLPEGQWQIIGLLSPSGDSPERLVLVRRTPAAALSPAA